MSARCPLSVRIRRTLRPSLASALVLFTLATPLRVMAQSGALFPQSFRIEHHLVQDDGDGSRFVSEGVVDTYGGSWIVSQRPDGSRLIVDLVKRELTEVDPGKGTYWTASFDRVVELESRLRVAQVTKPTGTAAVPGSRATTSPANSAGSAGESKNKANSDELVVSDVSDEHGKGSGVAASSVSTATGLSARPGVRHLRVSQRGETTHPGVDVWVDPTLRLTPSAVGALAAFDDALSGSGRSVAAQSSTSPPALEPARYLAAARAHAEGAIPIRTSRPAAVTDSGQPVGSVEDLATRVEPLDRFPTELAQIPEGLRRVPHPLEATVRFLEEEAVRNAAMSGAAVEHRP